MKTHWLYGMGPNKEIKFNIEIDVETKCSDCLHREVCNIDVERRCSNFEYGNGG